jgi:hypothetical protein
LLIACHATDGNLGAEKGGIGRAGDASAGNDGWEQLCGDGEIRKQFRGPGHIADVKEHSARGIAGIGDVNGAGGQVPDKPTVDGSGEELAGVRAATQFRRLFEEPGKLGSGEISIGNEASDALVGGSLLTGNEGVDLRLALAALPYDRRVDRSAGFTLPDDERFSLIGNADGGDP